MKNYYNACKLDPINHKLRTGKLPSDAQSIKYLQNSLNFETTVYTIVNGLNGLYTPQLVEA